MEMLKLFDKARLVSVPIVVVRTADQRATQEEITKEQNGHPLLQWDAAGGLRTANLFTPNEAAKKDFGSAALAQAQIKPADAAAFGFSEAMRQLAKLPPRSIVFVHNAHRQLQSMEPVDCAERVQSVANLRDELKRNHRMLVLLAPTFVAPPELEQDVVILDHALPGPEDLKTLVEELYASANASLQKEGRTAIPKPSAETLGRAVDALSGISNFAAEQVASMSMTEDGLDLDAMWERKCVAVEQIPGLTVWRGKEKFDDLVGLDALKTHLRRRIASKRPIGVVVWIDEIDKALANVEQDTSGVRMYQLLKLLTEMENNEWPGFVGVGVAGGGKSLVAKAFGNEAGVPTVALDLGATESKYVGESEANLLRVLQVIKAVGRGYAYFIATSNAATVMRPELQRRFYDGMWMFDLMTDAERAACWTFYLRKYGLKKQALPKDALWTGAEVRNACRYAADTGCTLLEAGALVVPMAQSRGEAIEELRHHAHGRFLDASKGGFYKYDDKPMQPAKRAIELPPLSPTKFVADMANLNRES